jgi:4'-phosphopantetheinyl transferase
VTDVPDWPTPVNVPDLDSGVVHLWRIHLLRERGAIEACVALLSSDERERMERFHFDLHRERFALRRGALRMLLGRYLAVDSRRVEFRYSPKGKPEVGSPETEDPLRFNFSDSSDWALLGLTRRDRIGVDIEEMRGHSDLETLARDHFSPRECEEFLSLPPSEKIAGFYNAWTRKEAWLKACGEGLSVPLSDFDVSLAPGEPPRLLRVRDEPGLLGCWALRACDPAPGYVGAVAVERERFRLLTWTFEMAGRARS